MSAHDLENHLIPWYLTLEIVFQNEVLSLEASHEMFDTFDKLLVLVLYILWKSFPSPYRCLFGSVCYSLSSTLYAGTL